MATTNGEDEARGTRGGKEPLSANADRDSLTEARRDRSSDGSEPIRGNGEDSEAANTQWREENLGKILSQLEELREAHLAYVNAHTDRLRARLAEDEEHRSKIITDMDALREEIILQMGRNGSASDEES